MTGDAPERSSTALAVYDELAPRSSTLDAFAPRIPDSRTRQAYRVAIGRFCTWCARGRLGPCEIGAGTLAAYLQQLKRPRGGGRPTSPENIAIATRALRRWFDFLAERDDLWGLAARRVRNPELAS